MCGADTCGSESVVGVGEKENEDSEDGEPMSLFTKTIIPVLNLGLSPVPYKNLFLINDGNHST